MRLDKVKYLIILFFVFSFFGGIPVEFGNEGAFFHGFMIPKPIITIGLGTNLKDVLIRSSSGMKIYEVKTDYKLVSDDAAEARIKGGSEKLTEKFVLLVTHAKDRKEAEAIASDLKRRIAGRVFYEEDRESTSGGLFEVRVGDFLTRGDALTTIRALNAVGWKDVWIVREDITERETRPIWMLLDNHLLPLDRDSVIYFIPTSPQSFLSFNGKSYRGFFILRGTPKGVVLVNRLNLEDYLKSVVPGELNPDQFNAIEALKAQAVAARTYAVKNMGLYKDYGFDLVDTPRSQYYSGMDSERPLSTRAVEETTGEVMRYKGELINALYMSTCGGRTEDAQNVFPGTPSPYLKSVECTYEKQKEWTLAAKGPILPILVGGRNASLDVAYLVGLGVISLGVEPLDFRADCPFEEAVEWLGAARRLLGAKPGEFAPDPVPLNFVGLARLLVQAFGWEERVSRLVLPTEVGFLLSDLPQVQGKDRGPMAYSLEAGIFPDSLKAGDPLRPVSRAELAVALRRVLSAEKDLVRTGTFRSAAKKTIEVGQDFERKTLRLSPHLYLLRNIDGADSFATRLTLLGGEKVQWIEREGEVAWLEVFHPPNSNVLDRSSRFNRWQVERSAAELGALVAPSCPVGRLVDVSVKARGVSGRVTELEIVGSDGRASLRGFQIREVLGLRDTLFVIDRSYDEAGRVTGYTFTGRGWGHGVGLCQVGAYGMAMAGGTYRDILKKYYQGVKVEKLG
ncbi:MAG TPA: SpoIID/LytB domain-containing protein [Terriglobales bacterium]|nr:SpoIID/LytB domain-containing protein [Terriglobales bacterium]